jgi:hypothetical protein
MRALAQAREMLVVVNLVALLAVSILAAGHLYIVVTREKAGPCTSAVEAFREYHPETSLNDLMARCLLGQIERGGR